MKYLKVWTNFLELIKELQYDEIGRLFEMMLLYVDTGAEPETFTGNERFLWPVAKQQIDFAAIRNEVLRQNGMKGGRPKSEETKRNQTKPNETKPNLAKAYKDNDKDNDKEKELFDDDDNARATQEEHNRVLDAAEDAGFQRTNSVRAKLIDLYAIHGLDKMLTGISSCVQHGATNLAYLEAVLKGGPKKTKAAVPAQDYHQRDYSGAQDDALARMMALDPERTGA